MSQAPVRLRREGERPDPLRFPFRKRELERLKPSDRRRWVYDDRTDGLALQITPNGKRSFYYCKRIEGRYRKVKLGDFPEITVEQARTLATRQAGKIAEGQNPAEAKREARAAMTMGDLFNYYMKHHAKPHKRTWQKDQRLYDMHLKKWAGRRLDQIKRGDVVTLHTRLGKTRPVQANRVLALLSKLFNTAAAAGYAGPNPAKGVKRFQEQQRERFMDESELPRFFEALDAEGNQVLSDFFRVLLFTGGRRGNVLSMRWDDIDLKRKVWTIPAEHFKTGQAVEVPLVPAVMDILNRRKAENAGRDEPSEYVFPNRRRDPRCPHLREPNGALTRICENAGIQGFRLHDLRRTCASWATMQGVPYPVVARMVGHKAQGVTSIYARFDQSAVRDGFEKTVNAMLAAKGGE